MMAQSDQDTASLVENGLVDSFGRTVTYLRLSVTDCTYCMSEKMTFLPKSNLLDADELEAVARAFIVRGVKKIRVTGGEPLVRRNILDIMSRLSGVSIFHSIVWMRILMDASLGEGGWIKS